MLDRETNKEQFACRLYDVYCEAVGGKAWDGRPLPSSEEFFYDAAKTKQADAWRAVAEFALTGSYKKPKKSSEPSVKVQRYFPEPAYDLTGPTYFVGDVHGEFARFNNHLADMERTVDLKPGNLIILGDIGLGFVFKNDDGTQVSTTMQFQDLCLDLHKRGWTVYCVRGNHDRPSEWWGSAESTAPGMPRMLRDNSTITINGKLFYIAGGATSVDKNARTPGKTWFEGEALFVPVEAMKDMKGKVYGILSHTGPTPPDIDQQIFLPNNVVSDLEWERVQLKRLERMQPEKWYFGHFHTRSSFDVNGIKCNCLDIFEIYEFGSYDEELLNYLT